MDSDKTLWLLLGRPVWPATLALAVVLAGIGCLMASRPCACGAVTLDGDQYVEGGHVLSGMDWMCVPDRPIPGSAA